MSAERAGPVIEAARIIRVLASHGVEFVVCGGVACLLHGVSRVTGDIDLCIALSPDNLNRFVAAARELQLQPRIPELLEATPIPSGARRGFNRSARW